jgi:ATP-binding cassette subfamily B protein
LTSWNIYLWLVKQLDHQWGPLLLLIFINVVISISSVAVAAVTKQMIDLSVAKNYAQALAYAGFFALLLILQMLLGAYLSLKTAKTKETMSYRLQKRFLERLYRTEWIALNKYHNGDIQTRLTSDVTNIVDGWTSTLPNIISLSVQLIAAFFTLWYYDPSLAVYAFLLGPISITISWFVGRKLKKMQHQIQDAESRYRSFLTETVRNILIVKTFEHEQDSMKQVHDLQQGKLHWIMKRNRFNAATGLIIGFGYRIGFFLAFGMGAYKLSRGTTSFGTFTAFLQLVGQIQGPLEGLSRTLPLIVTTLASAERLIEFEVLEAESEKTASPRSREEITSINFEDVSFSYEETNPILQNISFSVKPGEIVAIVGTSGEGKTTFLRLLLALLQPEEGNIYIRGSDYQDKVISSDTRSYFSYVPQGNTLFSGTVADNINIGRPSATEAELIAAAQTACAWDFIQSLPHGLQTIIGENGIGLSEGQAQRIAIARALLRDAPILLLDEATSALDLDTEWAVLESIKKMAPQKTCIAITHRLSVIDICDHIYRISEGKFVELNQKQLEISR